MHPVDANQQDVENLVSAGRSENCFVEVDRRNCKLPLRPARKCQPRHRRSTYFSVICHMLVLFLLV